MTTMAISPLQFNRDYVTKGEFREHKQYIKDGFEKVFGQIDNVETIVTNRIDLLESNMNKKFVIIDEKFDAVDKKFDLVGRRFDSLEKKMDGLEVKINNITNLLTKNNYVKSKN